MEGFLTVTIALNERGMKSSNLLLFRVSNYGLRITDKPYGYDSYLEKIVWKTTFNHLLSPIPQLPIFNK